MYTFYMIYMIIHITSFCSMIMHSPMLQRSVHNSWKLKTSQFLHGQHSPDMSPIEHILDALDRRIRHRVPVPLNIQQLRTAIEEEWTNIPQATINNLINSMRRRCVALHEASGSHTRYWLLFGPQGVGVDPRVCLRHTCEIIMLSNQHLDMPHLWGGWIMSVKEKCSLTQILTYLWTIFERNRSFVCIEKVLDLWVQLMKNGGKNKSVVFIILFIVCSWLWFKCHNVLFYKSYLQMY